MTVRRCACSIPAGPEPGIFVHRVLQAADFQAGELTGELTAAIAAEQARRSIAIGDVGVLAAGLAAAIATPLGSLTDGNAAP